jgi:hypothetical protein
VLTATLSLFSGCAFIRQTGANVPSITIAALSPSASKKMVIVLPGARDDVKAMQRSGIVAVIQQSMPDADVVLIALTMSYYLEGRAMERLHEQIVLPARQAGYLEIYLAGASLGGMGVLRYESAYPGEMTGLVLMAPYMGKTSLVEKIIAGGGLSKWQTELQPTVLMRYSSAPDEWRVVQSLSANRERARQVWLVCGQEDRYRGAAQLIAQVLLPENYIEPGGAHIWPVWTEGASKVFKQIRHSGSTAVRQSDRATVRRLSLVDSSAWFSSLCWCNTYCFGRRRRCVIPQSAETANK